MPQFILSRYYAIFVFLFSLFNVLNANPVSILSECTHLNCSKKPKNNSERNYYTFNYPSNQIGGQTLLTGIRGVKNTKNKVYISGFYNSPDGVTVIPFVYKGTLSGKGSWHVLNYPSSPGATIAATNLYGPNNGPDSTIRVVGNYNTVETDTDLGCLYEGPLDGSGNWTTLVPPSSEPVLATIAHSTMGGLVVGNYNTQIRVSKAFIYEIETGQYHEIIKPHAKDVTAYGIWHDGGHSYTICGGYSDFNAKTGIGSAYIVDWNNQTKELSNWRSYNYGNDPVNAIITHFDGITSNGEGGYNLTGDWVGFGHFINQGFYCEIKKNHAKWFPISYPGKTITSGNSVFEKIVIGSYADLRNFSVNGYVSVPRKKRS